MSDPLFPTLCPGCFADKGESAVCPHCGYDENAPRGVLLLPHRTVLNHQYLIGCTLGKLGGFGITYLAWDMHLETPVAIKEFLPRDLAGRDSNHLTITAHSREDNALFLEGLELFIKEARTLAKFDHENIVRVRNVLEENGTAYLVMNFYEGTTLAAHLEQKGGRLPEKIALSILLPVLDGLREVHAKGFLHRDIKPQNIYLTKTGIPILLDFGSARRVMGERTRSMTVLMTPGYAPFEQYHRKGQQGPWTDIYACGATLYHMLTGVIPTEATGRAAHDILQPPANLQPDISPAVSTIIMKAMAMNCEARPATVAEFMDALIQAKEGGLADYTGKSKLPEIQLTLPEVQEPALSPYFKAALSKGNAAYYLARFTRFNLNWGELLKPSWNSVGFIFNAFWLLYRRIFGFGVLFFFMPILLMILFNSKMIGFGCWMTISIVIGCYGNALYFLTLSRRISKIQQQFPGDRLQPLKLSRLASTGESSLRIPLVYFCIALVAIYANEPFHIWLSTKPEKNLSLISNPSRNSPPEQELQNTSDDTLNENNQEDPSYDAYQYQQKADKLLQTSDWSALLEHSQKWCNLDRTNPEAWLAFGLANFNLAQFTLAQPAFETYFRLKPEDNDSVLGYLAKTYVKLKKKTVAELTLLKVIALRSKYN
jgi:serine/threonine protein kinase